MKRKKTILRSLCIFIMVVMIFSLFPATVSAHESVHLQATINEREMKYNVYTIYDRPGWSRESNHFEARTARFDKIFSLYANDITTDPIGTEASNVSNNKHNPLINLTLDDTKDLKFFKAVELGIPPGGSRVTLAGTPTDSIIEARSKVSMNGGSIFNEGIGNGRQVPESGKGGFVFSFPAKEQGAVLNGLLGGGNSKVSEADYNRAYEVSATLMANLNGILSAINGGQRYKDVSSLIKASIYTRPKKDGGYFYTVYPGPNGEKYALLYGSKVNKVSGMPKNPPSYTGYFTYDPEKKSYSISADEKGFKRYIDYMQHADNEGNLYVHVIRIDPVTNTISTSNDSTFIYAMQKGYIAPVGATNPLIKNGYDFETSGVDVIWLTIHHLAFQANYNYTIMGLNSENTREMTEEDLGKIEEIIADIFRKILSGLKSALGLYDVTELVYNKGIRGTQLYNEGTMTNNWWAIVLRYHVIFQIIAWAVIAIAILKVLLQLNLSTINPQVRMSIMETIQKFFIVGFFLAVCIPFIRFLVSLNNSIVGIFATQVDLDRWNDVSTGGYVLVSILIQFVYLGIFIYLNFIYIMRSIMIALLTASAPIFIVSMAFSSRGKGLFDNWLKELSANIFLQGFHAFALAFLFNIVGVTRGIEQIAITLSLIPLTEWIRTQFFGQSGQAAGQLGGKLASMAVQAGSSALKKAGGAALGMTKGALTAGVTKEGEGEGGAKSGGMTGDGGGGTREAKNSQTLQDAVKQRTSTWNSKFGKGAAAVLNTAAGFANASSNIVSSLAQMGIGAGINNTDMMMEGAARSGAAIADGAFRASAATVKTGAAVLEGAGKGVANNTSVGRNAIAGVKSGMEKVSESTSKILHKEPGFRTRDTGANTSQLITKADHTDGSISLVRDSRGNVTPSISNLKLDSSRAKHLLGDGVSAANALADHYDKIEALSEKAKTGDQKAVTELSKAQYRFNELKQRYGFSNFEKTKDGSYNIQFDTGKNSPVSHIMSASYSKDRRNIIFDNNGKGTDYKSVFNIPRVNGYEEYKNNVSGGNNVGNHSGQSSGGYVKPVSGIKN